MCYVEYCSKMKYYNVEYFSRVKCVLCSVPQWNEVCIRQSLSVVLSMNWVGLISGLNYAVRGVLQ
jgi:hypothetical protein